MRYFVWGALAVALAVALAGLGLYVAREARKVETPPFWYPGNRLDWGLDHRLTPDGADEVSRAIISLDGISYVPWRKERLACLTFNSSLRWGWEGDRLLARYVDGKPGFFSGGGQIHPPLAADPWQAHAPLRQCLGHADAGAVLPGYRRGPTAVELMEAAGGKVVRP